MSKHLLYSAAVKRYIYKRKREREKGRVTLKFLLHHTAKPYYAICPPMLLLWMMAPLYTFGVVVYNSWSHYIKATRASWTLTWFAPCDSPWLSAQGQRLVESNIYRAPQHEPRPTRAGQHLITALDAVLFKYWNTSNNRFSFTCGLGIFSIRKVSVLLVLLKVK